MRLTMSEQSESYMNGWRAGYHNATLAERERIIKLLENYIDTEPISSEEDHAIRAFRHMIAYLKGQQND